MEVTRWVLVSRNQYVDQYCSIQGSNALVMPAEGNKFTISKDLPVVGKILSRKQRKRLEQIVEKKKKKESRAELLAALKSVQVRAETETFLGDSNGHVTGYRLTVWRATRVCPACRPRG